MTSKPLRFIVGIKARRTWITGVFLKAVRPLFPFLTPDERQELERFARSLARVETRMLGGSWERFHFSDTTRYDA